MQCKRCISQRLAHHLAHVTCSISIFQQLNISNWGVRLADFNAHHNGMLPTNLTMFKDQNDRFGVLYSGGDKKTRGMVSLVVGYANRNNEHTGGLC